MRFLAEVSGEVHEVDVERELGEPSPDDVQRARAAARAALRRARAPAVEAA